MQGFHLALFQQGAAVQPSILLKHLDPNTRQEAQQDIAAYKTKLKDEREQNLKKQKTVQARAANLPADLTEQQRRRMGTPKTHAAKKSKSHEGQRLQPPKTDAAKKRKSHQGQRRKHATCPICNKAKIRDEFTNHAWLKLTKKKEHALCRTCTPKAVPSI